MSNYNFFKFEITSPLGTQTVIADKASSARAAAADFDQVEFRETSARWIPEVGDGAHYGINGDAYPCTVIAVSKSGHRVEVRDDKARAIESAAYREGPVKAIFALGGDDAPVRVYTRRKGGAYLRKGCEYERLGPSRKTARNPHV